MSRINASQFFSYFQFFLSVIIKYYSKAARTRILSFSKEFPSPIIVWGQNGVKLANSTYFYTIKKAPRKPREALNLLLAERVGFEPTVPCGTLDFELFEGKFR